MSHLYNSEAPSDRRAPKMETIRRSIKQPEQQAHVEFFEDTVNDDLHILRSFLTQFHPRHDISMTRDKRAGEVERYFGLVYLLAPKINRS